MNDLELTLATLGGCLTFGSIVIFLSEIPMRQFIKGMQERYKGQAFTYRLPTLEDAAPIMKSLIATYPQVLTRDSNDLLGIRLEFGIYLKLPNQNWFIYSFRSRYKTTNYVFLQPIAFDLDFYIKRSRGAGEYFSSMVRLPYKGKEFRVWKSSNPQHFSTIRPQLEALVKDMAYPEFEIIFHKHTLIVRHGGNPSSKAITYFDYMQTLAAFLIDQATGRSGS